MLPLIMLNYMYFSNLFQALSGTVSKALSFTGGEVASETALFVSMMDRFFDCVNVGNYTEGKHGRTPFKQPYPSSSDFQLRVSGSRDNEILQHI